MYTKFGMELKEGITPVRELLLKWIKVMREAFCSEVGMTPSKRLLGIIRIWMLGSVLPMSEGSAPLRLLLASPRNSKEDKL